MAHRCCTRTLYQPPGIMKTKPAPQSFPYFYALKSQPMKRKFLFVFTLILTPFTIVLAQGGAKPKPKPTAVKPATPAPVKLKSLKDSASYALGYNVGQSLSQSYTDMDVNILAQALKDAYSAKPPAVPVESAQQVVMSYKQQVAGKKAAGNKAEGEAFLKKNATQPGVTTTSSGLQYLVMRKGDGPLPAVTDRVKVHYFGTLINGTEFDNSYKRNAPAEFALTGVIAGWTEALQLMPVGSKYKLFIPSTLGYGDNQMGPSIPPGSTLIFEVELLEILK